MLWGKFRGMFRQVPGPVMLRGKFRHSFRQVPDRFRAGSGEVPKQVPVMLWGKFRAGSGRFREGSGQVPARFRSKFR